MMKSPRWLRPHSVVVVNLLPEEDWEEKTSEAVLEYVKVTINTSANYGTTGRSLQDVVTVTIDANDLKATKEFRQPDEFKHPMTQFTLRPGDRIIYDGRSFEITGVKHVNPLRNAPEFIEVTAA